MTATATPDAAKAQARLDRLERCEKIDPFQAGDEETLCGNDSLPIIRTKDGWRHDPAEIKRLRELAGEGVWPK